MFQLVCLVVLFVILASSQDAPDRRSQWSGTWTPVEDSCVMQNCCCSVAPVVSTLLEDDAVQLEGRVNGGPQCRYLDQLSAVLQLQPGGNTAIFPMRNFNVTASINHDGDSLLITSSDAPGCRNVLRRTTSQAISPLISPSATNADSAVPLTNVSSIANSVNSSMFITPINSNIDMEIGLPETSPSIRIDDETITTLTTNWLGFWEINPESCISRDDCCCPVGFLNISLINSQELDINSSAINCTIPHQYWLIDTNTAQANDTEFVAVLLSSNLHLLQGSANCSTIARRYTNQSASSDINFNVTDASGSPNSTTVSNSSEVQPSVPLSSEIEPISSSIASAVSSIDMSANSSVRLNEHWKGIYQSTRQCQPGPRCCCSRGPIHVEDYPHTAAAIRVSSALDAGVACFRMDRLAGDCYVINSGTALCQGEQEYQGKLYKMNFTLSLSEDGQKLSVDNSFYPNCLSIGQKKVLASSGAVHVPAAVITVLALLIATSRFWD